jgi:hypothetical protein
VLVPEAELPCRDSPGDKGARPVLAVEAELSRHAFSLTDTFLADNLSLWRRLIVVHVIDDFEPVLIAKGTLTGS